MITLALQEIIGKDTRFLRLADNSFYDPNLPVENGILEITPPGYSCAMFYGKEPGFNSVFNSSSLRISVAKTASELTDLPDGVYKLKYSIKPNTLTAVEYEILRNTQLLQRYIGTISQLLDTRGEIIKRDFDKQISELTWIKDLIDNAKYKVDDCGHTKAGLELYEEADRLLNEYNRCYCR